MFDLGSSSNMRLSQVQASSTFKRPSNALAPAVPPRSRRSPAGRAVSANWAHASAAPTPHSARKTRYGKPCGGRVVFLAQVKTSELGLCRTAAGGLRSNLMFSISDLPIPLFSSRKRNFSRAGPGVSSLLRSSAGFARSEQDGAQLELSFGELLIALGKAFA